MTKWAELMSEAPFQGRSSRVVRKDARELKLDELLYDFASSSENSATFPGLGKAMRKWVHVRAESLKDFLISVYGSVRHRTSECERGCATSATETSTSIQRSSITAEWDRIARGASMMTRSCAV